MMNVIFAHKQFGRNDDCCGLISISWRQGIKQFLNQVLWREIEINTTLYPENNGEYSKSG